MIKIKNYKMDSDKKQHENYIKSMLSMWKGFIENFLNVFTLAAHYDGAKIWTIKFYA